MPRLILSIGLVLLAALANAATRGTTVTLRYVDMAQASAGALVLDTRARSACVQRSLAGAHCLPAKDLLGPHGELPGFADLFWALGTAGIDGSETVLVTGDNRTMRDFVAGLLYVCGQARVEILDSKIKTVLHAGSYRVGPGQPRAMLRQRIYHARMRDQVLLLPGELSRQVYRKLQLIPVDASRYPSNTSTFTKLRQNRRHPASGHAHYLIYARRPSLALALFARLQASRTEQTSQIRVVPVAVQGLRASHGMPLRNTASTMFPAFIASITRGGKSWT